MAQALNDQFVFEYFSQLNSIAHKIQSEINQKIATTTNWQNLPANEKYAIINDAIIRPEIQLNYEHDPAPPSHGYRDCEKSLLHYFVTKHGGERPFSYKTKSQLNLFYSFDADAAAKADDTLPRQRNRSKNVNKSTESLSCNFINLNLSMSGSVAGPSGPKLHAPIKASTTPTKIKAKENEAEDSNNIQKRLLAPDDDDVDEFSSIQTETSENDDESKALLISTTNFDFLNNW